MSLSKAGIIASIVIPCTAAVYYVGQASDKLNILDTRVSEMEHIVDQLNNSQVGDEFVNKQVEKLTTEMEWLKFHHHHGDGIAHID